MTAVAEEFESQRPRLFGLAYRLLGSAAEAEDAVQDAYLRLHAADRATIGSLPAWLTKVVTNLCLNRLTSARARREIYVGPWLPEPVITSDGILSRGRRRHQHSDVEHVTAELALGEPVSGAPDFGGPQVRAVSDLARSYLEIVGKHRMRLPIRLPGKVFRAYRAGGHLAPEHAQGTIAFEQYLGGQCAAGVVPYAGAIRAYLPLPRLKEQR